MVRLTTVLMTRGLFKWRAAAIGYALAALGSCEMPQWGLPLLFGVSRDRRHVRKMVCDRARPSSENSVCAESVDNPDYHDGRKNDYPIGNLNARYRRFPGKPFHGFPPR
jgi:hypothetical protein